MKAKIVYYTGTGGSEIVANTFKENLISKNIEVSIERIISGKTIKEEEFDTLFLIYAVHAFNAPAPVYSWIDDNFGENKMAVVISVSAGGEMISNTACRTKAIKKLSQRGFDVIYEQMVIMPNNWMIPTSETLSLLLLDILPIKVNKIVDDIINGVRKRTSPILIDRLISYCGEGENKFTVKFGQNIITHDSCTACGLCVKNCPSKNISIIDQKASFDSKCDMCLGCIYSCPQGALEAGKWKFQIIKTGFSLKLLSKRRINKSEIDIKQEAKGFLWSGVRKYLLEE
ncbi:MAG: hypothetical protein H6Q15_38 [Bacteroidetes bacterium]|nr:hypothetical protein [Bacteroidota bacterium]